MKAFQKAFIPRSEDIKHIEDHMQAWRAGNSEARAHTPALDEAGARAQIQMIINAIRKEEEIWKNDLYQVNVRKVNMEALNFPNLIHLSIKRIDRAPIHDWRELQEIKNELVGPDHEAVELYPAESRKVDTANQYHLWVLADKGLQFPFGYADRLVQDSTYGKAVNRKLEKS